MKNQQATRLRKSGIEIIGDVPWGTHFCQFYQTQQDLLDTLVPYFTAGLISNEFCMWVTAEPLHVEDATKALRQSVPDLDLRLAKGQIEIIPHTDWYLLGGAFDQDRVLNGWVEKLNNALVRGYEGLRLTGNTFWLEKDDWQDFTDYEEAVNNVIGSYRMLALCTYSVDKCGAGEVADVIANHEFAMMKRFGEWTVIDSSTVKQAKQALEAANEELIASAEELEAMNEELRAAEDELRSEIEDHRQAEEELRESEERYRMLFDKMSEGFAFCEMIRDEQGKHYDFRYLDVNPAWEKHTGVAHHNVIGNTIREIFPGIESFWIEKYAEVVRTGKSMRLENQVAELGRWFEVFAYKHSEDHFAVIFSDITERKLQEQEKQELFEREHHIAETLQEALIPTQIPTSVGGCQFTARYVPALNEAAVGGDFYDIFELGDGKVGVLIGDIAGKGLQAAMRVSAARYTIRSYAFHDPRPSKVMTMANDTLSYDKGDDFGMLTAFFAVVDTRIGAITYTNAGHEPPVIRHMDGKLEELKVGGRALGVMPGLEYPEASLKLSMGDLVVMVTDGITEARNEEIHLFGKEGLLRFLSNSSGNSSPDRLVESLLQAAVKHAGGSLQDDVAVVVLGLEDMNG